MVDFWQARPPQCSEVRFDIFLSGGFTTMAQQSTLDLRNPIFPFLNRELFDLRKIYVLILKTGHPKKMSYVGEFAS